MLDCIVGLFLFILLLMLVSGCGIVYAPNYEAEYDSSNVVDIPPGVPIEIIIPTVNVQELP